MFVLDERKKWIIDLYWLFRKGWVIRPSVFHELTEEIYKDKDLFDVFYEQKRAEPVLFAEITHAAKHDTNIIIEIIGPPGTGKSILGQTLAYHILEEFEKHGHRKEPIFAMSYSDATERLREIAERVSEKHKGDNLTEEQLIARYIDELRGYVMIIDEQTKQHGPGSQIERDNFENVINTVRAAQLNFILIYPRRRVEMGHFVIRTIAYHKKTMKNFAIVYTTSMKPIGVIFLKKPVEKFPWEEQYWKVKYQKVWQMIKEGGLDIVKKHPLAQIQKGTVKYEGDLTDFEWETAVFNILKNKDERIAWIWYLNFVEGKSPRTHMAEYMEKTGRKKSWIYQKIKELNQDQAFWGLIAEIRGKLWEDFLAKNYESQGFEVLREEDCIKQFGEKADLLLLKDGKPIEVINAKCGISGTSYPPHKFQPEINLAKKLGIKAYIEFFNINTRRRIKKEIDTENPKTISF